MPNSACHLKQYRLTEHHSSATNKIQAAVPAIVVVMEEAAGAANAFIVILFSAVFIRLCLLLAMCYRHWHCFWRCALLRGNKVIVVVVLLNSAETVPVIENSLNTITWLFYGAEEKGRRVQYVT